MKAMKTMLAVMVATSMALAQAPATTKPKAPASQTVTGQAAAPAPKPAAAPTAQKPAAKAPAKPAKAPTTAAKAPAAKKPAATAAEPAAKPEAAAAKKPVGKRDPFVSPIVRAGAGGPGAVCATGKRCLMIGDMILRGVVRTPSGMIAVVSNQANRAYFLKENDPVFNGMVLKITADSVVFRENTVDNLGRETTREVIKRVSAPTV